MKNRVACIIGFLQPLEQAGQMGEPAACDTAFMVLCHEPDNLEYAVVCKMTRLHVFIGLPLLQIQHA